MPVAEIMRWDVPPPLQLPLQLQLQGAVGDAYEEIKKFVNGLGGVHGVLDVYAGIAEENRAWAFVVVVWETRAHHDRAVYLQSQSGPPTRTRTSSCSTTEVKVKAKVKIRDIVQFNNTLTHALGAPVTEVVCAVIGSGSGSDDGDSDGGGGRESWESVLERRGIARVGGKRERERERLYEVWEGLTGRLVGLVSGSGSGSGERVRLGMGTSGPASWGRGVPVICNPTHRDTDSDAEYLEDEEGEGEERNWLVLGWASKQVRDRTSASS
uniref:Uncharacterized protein n=1 Tax=Psilocybe cubensis TaxID=181762 RepID=A0A8H7XT94_PSICU